MALLRTPHKLKDGAAREQGFTLVELLVVILIIGILSAIALPSFINQRGKAQDSEAKSAARTAQTAMETWYTDHQDYTGVTAADLIAIEPALTDALNLAVSGTGSDTYVVTVETRSKAGETFSIDKASNGFATRTCTNPGNFGCKAAGGGTW